MTENKDNDIKEPEYREYIDRWIDGHREEMIEDLKSLVRIASVKGEAREGMPFGEMPARAVHAMQEMMERYGLRVTNYENYCIAGDLDAEGGKALDILAHLDVVPVSDTWTKTAPFEPLVEGDRIYGRGTSDDKGPAVAALYAMRCIRELGLDLKNGVRLICGSDEESGSADLEYYYAREKEALYTFSPDSHYPLINIEKGRLSRKFCAEGAGAANAPKAGYVRILSINVGDAPNIVPGRGTMVISGASDDMLRKAADETEALTGGSFSWKTEDGKSVVTAAGESAHAASPELGINSVTMLLELIKRLPVTEEDGSALLRKIGQLWPHGDYYGEGLGVGACDEESGKLTMTLDILRYDLSEDGGTFRLEGAFDCRAPLCCDDNNLTAKVRARLKAEGLAMEEGNMTPVHYVSADSEIVRKLLESYELYFGKKGEPFAIGGGTYVHDLERGVAFGCAVPGVDNRMHGDDEFMEIPVLVTSAKIFADAIMRLCS